MDKDKVYDQISSILNLFKTTLEHWKSDLFNVQSKNPDKNFPQNFVDKIIVMSDSCRNLEILVVQVSFVFVVILLKISQTLVKIINIRGHIVNLLMPFLGILILCRLKKKLLALRVILSNCRRTRRC